MRSSLVFALIVLSAACGKDENNTTSNNMTSNNATPNNASNNIASNNATSNNAMSNNMASSNATTNNTTYTPVDWTCDEVTPAGAIADAVGTWSIEDGCIAVDPYTPVYQLCSGAVVTKYDVPAWGGFFQVNADNTFVQGLWADGEQSVFMPQECVAPVGAGDCPSIQTVLQGVFDRAGGTGGVTCGDSPGGCLCDVEGRGWTRNVGTLESNADGMVTLHYFANDGTAAQADWTFAVDATELSLQDGDNSSFSAGMNGGASECEVYCTGFVANCHGVDGVTDYADYDDCVTDCGTLTVAGSPQMTGDSLECRTYHLFVSADPSDAANQTTHCPHAQFAPTGECMN